MHNRGRSRSFGLWPSLFLAGALFLAILPPALRAADSPPVPAALPAIQLTMLPGAVSGPVHVTNAGDGSGRLFVVEQGGYIRVFKNGAYLPTDFLDIHTLVGTGSEQGLLSVAFHPNYASNGFFYVYYTDTIASPGDITIARYQVSADPDVANPGSAQIVLVVPHPTNSNHNGGQLMFGPVDHYLYIATGDGGSGGDPPNNAQTLSVLLGKMLRIDVDGSGTVPCGQSTPMPYAIPPDNPFASIAGCDEIWAYGLRNPWRFGFDRETARPLHRGRRPEPLRGDRLRAGGQHGRRELWLAIDGGAPLLQPFQQLQRRLADPADPGNEAREPRRRVVRHRRGVPLSGNRHPGAGRDVSVWGHLQGGDLGSDRVRRDLDRAIHVGSLALDLELR